MSLLEGMGLGGYSRSPGRTIEHLAGIRTSDTLLLPSRLSASPIINTTLEPVDDYFRSRRTNHHEKRQGSQLLRESSFHQRTVGVPTCDNAPIRRINPLHQPLPQLAM